ncbi:hypothetical protein AOLI_G00244580 [Acnodon oligacanthus]
MSTSEDGRQALRQASGGWRQVWFRGHQQSLISARSAPPPPPSPGRRTVSLWAPLGSDLRAAVMDREDADRRFRKACVSVLEHEHAERRALNLRPSDPTHFTSLIFHPVIISTNANVAGKRQTQGGGFFTLPGEDEVSRHCSGSQGSRMDSVWTCPVLVF